MKNVKLPILGLTLVLAVASCQKNDFKEEAFTDLSTSSTALNAADTIGWKSVGQWEIADQETFSVHYFSIEDPAITAEVADNGLLEQSLCGADRGRVPRGWQGQFRRRGGLRGWRGRRPHGCR